MSFVVCWLLLCVVCHGFVVSCCGLVVCVWLPVVFVLIVCCSLVVFRGLLFVGCCFLFVLCCL